VPGKLNDGSSHEYGFGWFIQEKDGGPAVAAHSGGWVGYRTYIRARRKQIKFSGIPFVGR
jgi:hypothetical protein